MAERTHPDSHALAQFAAGRLKGTAQTTVELHLRGCEVCHAVLAAVGDTVAPSGPHPIPRSTNADPQPGEMLGEFRVLEELGQGGMGVLYRGEQPVIGKQVAIKVVSRAIANDADTVERLIEEARAVNAIRHPNIVDIFSFGTLRDGRPYLVMELLEGLELADLLHEKERLTAAETMTVLAQATAALEAAHAVGVIHRDVKPENIVVNPRRDGWRVTLLDFGLAKRTGGGDTGTTNAGVILGTPAYMAPEQIRGEKATAAADVYALGILAWKLLAGHGPFEGGSIADVLHRQIHAPAPPLKPVAPGIPVGLEVLVGEMLSKDASLRPSMAEVRRRVQALAAPAVAAPPRPSRVPLLAATTAIVLAAVTWLALKPEPATDRAVTTPLGPPRTQPVKVAVVEPPVAAPIAPVAPVIDLDNLPPETTAKRWSCAKIVNVSPVYDTEFKGDWQVFQILFDYESSLLVTTQPPANKKALRKLRASVLACKDSAKEVAAAHTLPFGGFPTKSGLWLKGPGLRAEITDVAIAEPKKTDP